ncbi:MAG: hypothetical protein NT105_08540 [Verrucomicrobia bacterium]|nr:hypothetical protein [Verrucomicrobiota bacterium]
MLRFKWLLVVCCLAGTFSFIFVTDVEAVESGALAWDTGKHSAKSLSPDAVAKREGWKGVTGENVSVSSDVCVANEYLTLVFRKGARGGEWYYRLGEATVKGPTLVPVGPGGDKAKTLDAFKVIDSTATNALLEVNATTEAGKKTVTRFFLKKGKPFVETQPGDGTEKILVEARSHHAVMPDPFAGDLVVSAQETEANELRFPGEHVLAQLADNGNAIVMCAWRSADQAVKVMLDGEGEKRMITGTEISYRKDRRMNVWVAVLAAPAIWHQKKIGDLNAVKDVKLDWKIPYLALWRADYRREHGWVDSWKVIIKKPNGEWEGFGVSPKKGGTVWHARRGTFAYPTHLEGESVYVRNPVYEGNPPIKNNPNGLAVIYPFQRIGKSPKNVYGVMDVLTEALEDMPEFTLAEEWLVKRPAWDRYPGVCYTTGEVEKIFDDDKERQKKKEIVERFKKMNLFCITVRRRIEEYMNWWKKTHEFCARSKAAKPQAAALVDELDGQLSEMDKVYENRKLAERTPAAANALTDQIEAFVGSDDPKRVDKVKELGRATRTIGGNQDSGAGYLRMVAKETRQQAGYRMMTAKDDASFDFANEIRRRTLEVLRTSMGVEGGFTD